MASRVVSITILQNERPRMSPTKYLQRSIIRAWKSVSRATRKSYRASILPEDFVILTNRRRSIFYSSA
ncbi:unnamed protein product [Somion occarium]|uniref:Uncharacterized protein n=1 Tax=Somion occarium TaxID=3059160 RepID=A0ABP1E3T3_9APHY